MAYQVIQPPFTLEFDEMPPEDLKEYSRWFHSVLPGRTSQLETAVRSTLGFESWRATFDAASLGQLGEWFEREVSTRPRSPAEVAEVRIHGLVEEPGPELTNRTFSLAMDIAFYFAETMRRCHPAVSWKQPLGSRKDADFGQPVLVGFGKVRLNPVRICVTLAYGIASGSQSGTRLREIFDYWSHRVSA